MVVATLIIGFLAPAIEVSAAAPGGNASSSFYKYSGSTPLASIAPGTVLQSRTFTFFSFSTFTNLTVTQLLYRSTSVLGQPTANVTSVIHPTTTAKSRAISIQTGYDSLNTADEPSVALDGGNIPSGVDTSWLSSGVTVVVPDTEGQNADLGEGNEYGMNTLDSLRAATSSSLTGLSNSTQIALMGYSGGALATEWAAQLALSYAPDVNKQLVGAALGGLPVDEAHTAAYLNGNNGSSVFSPEIPIGMVGLSRAYGFNFKPYLSATGLSIFNNVQNQNMSLGTAIFSYWHVYYSEIFSPAYVNPNSMPGYTAMINKENLGLVSPATIPLYIMEGASGAIEGAYDSTQGLGNGDGTTPTGDVRTLAHQACSAGTSVEYTEQPYSDHLITATQWSSPATSWVNDRFNGIVAQNNCSTIVIGNSLAAEVSTAR